MPRLPNRVQGSPFGTLNLGRGNLPRTAPSILQPGPAPSPEQFNHRQGVPAAVARAMNDLQTGLSASTAQATANPTGNKQLFENVPLVQGGAGGTAPFIKLAHGLGASYRGYSILTQRGGFVTAHAAINPSVAAPGVSNPTPAQPASAYLVLWVQFTAFGSATPTIDVEAWA